MLSKAEIHGHVFRFLAKRLDGDRVMVENDIRHQHVVTEQDEARIQDYITEVVKKLMMKSAMP